ncbi:MAG: NAD-dependent epimerase/dehydratase family protein [Deltaproteobacteria bacterium]|nr:NAD-dependent epimerase/dehydratase family protein [Deltaproteobacteria bacterium]
MKALVLGAGGFIGLNLVDALLAAGHTPRCGRRARSNVLPLRSRKVPLVPADLEDPEGLQAAMRDVDVVFHAAGHYPRFAHRPEEALQAGLRQTRNVLDAAAAAGVRRLVYASTTATVARGQAGSSNEGHVFASAPEHGTYHRLKWHMEAQALAEDRLEVRVACPAGCIGPWDLRVGTSALLVGTARGLDPPHPDGVVNLVDARDVAQGMLQLAALEESPRRVILSGSTHRLQDLLQLLARRYHVAPPSPPLTTAEAVALADAEERRAAEGGPRASLSREIVDLILYGVPLDAGLSERALGLRYRSLEDTLDAFDAWARRMRLIPEPSPQEELPA